MPAYIRWLAGAMSLTAVTVAVGQPLTQTEQEALSACLDRRTLGELTDCLAQQFEPPPAEQTAATQAAEIATRNLPTIATESVPEAIAAKTTSTAPTDAFGDRVGDAISDFLPLFQWAVDSIETSDDKKSVTLKFNPSPAGVSFQATLAEPEVFEDLAKMIVEPAREAQRDALLEGIDDFADATLSAHYGWSRRAADWQGAPRAMFGRHYDLYENLVDDLVSQAVLSLDPQLTARVSATDLASIRLFEEGPCRVPRDFVGNLSNLDLHTDFSGECRADLLPDLTRRAHAAADLGFRIEQLQLGALPALIDNQPQLVFTGSYRFADPVVAPEELSFGVQFEMGRYNFNDVLRQYRRRDNVLEAYQSVLAAAGGAEVVDDEVKVIFGLTFKQRQSYTFTHDYTLFAAPEGGGEPLEIPQQTAVDLPQSEEWRGKIVYTRFAGPARAVEPPQGPQAALAAIPREEWRQNLIPTAAARRRFNASLEFVETDDSLRQDRLIGRLSYVVPVAGGLSIPISLTWSNKGEFLGDQDEVVAGHLGISYGLDRKQ